MLVVPLRSTTQNADTGMDPGDPEIPQTNLVDMTVNGLAGCLAVHIYGEQV